MDLLFFGSIAMGRVVLSVQFTDSKIPISILIALNKPTCPISIYSHFLGASTPRVCLDYSSQTRRNTALSKDKLLLSSDRVLDLASASSRHVYQLWCINHGARNIGRGRCVTELESGSDLRGCAESTPFSGFGA
jgi:hypothetical protein